MIGGALRTYYYLRIPNVGDAINADVISAVSGHSTVWNNDPAQPHLLAIGSVMAAATPSSIVWGAGVMHPRTPIENAEAANIVALRGPLSVSALRAAGVEVADVPLGDPGFLAPELLGIRKSQTPAYELGVVPHYVDREHPELRRLGGSSGALLLNVHDEPFEFLQQMAKCRAVISTSLHGLIFAEALGIPNLWLKVSNAIAGEDFKYADWFATTKRPQKTPYALKGAETVSQLAQAAELHECTIDREALKRAFPTDRVQEFEQNQSTRMRAKQSRRDTPTPVFLISFNRADMLRRCIGGLGKLNRACEVIVHDNGSTDEETLDLLVDLEKAGTRVVRDQAITHPDELNRVNVTIQQYFQDWAEPVRYIVSDCDIDVSIAQPDMLDVFDDLLNANRVVEAVGPMLRIRDIPREYPLYNRAINVNVDQFWRRTPTIVKTEERKVAVLECPIDTSFALHRAGEPFRRLKRSLRVYEPYEALHLDWYLGANEEASYIDASAPSLSHWSNRAARELYKSAALRWPSYKAVRAAPDGSPEVYDVSL